jgi:hypothetical protein
MTMTELTEPLMAGERGEEPSEAEVTTIPEQEIQQEETTTPTPTQGLSSEEDPQTTQAAEV